MFLQFVSNLQIVAVQVCILYLISGIGFVADKTKIFRQGDGKKLVDLVHEYGKKAYGFYDDSWVGVEPYGERFPEFGFDGLIKCVFSGYEARLCAGAKVETH